MICVDLTASAARKVTLIGNLGKTPEIQALEGGTKVAKFGRVSRYLFAKRKFDIRRRKAQNTVL